ncbi:MAG: hypothetical protein HY293_14780 [Planctomycetes bacterium]|nr:hypothetical protein [Planctomycetota bacterium]
MRTLLRPLMLPALLASLTGCLSHMPAKEDSCSLHIRWLEDFEVARGAASKSGRPILAVMVAGELREHC